MVSQASASPFPEQVGTFTRSDGGLVTAFQMDDGSVMYTGTLCWFVLQDGSTVFVGKSGKAIKENPNRQERFYQACAVRNQDAAAEVYRYESAHWPVASLVQQFDGYRFVDVTTSGKRWLSPFVHISHYWIGYLINAAFLSFLIIIGARSIRKMPARGWGLASRILSVFLGIFIVGFFAFIPMTSGPHSPEIQAILAVAGIMLYLTARKAIAKKRSVSIEKPPRNPG